MWISEKAARSGKAEIGDIAVGSVSVGGEKPSVELNGEQISASLAYAGAVYLPKAGDEVLVLKDFEGESFIIGKTAEGLPKNTGRGDICIGTNKGSFIRLRSDGTLELSGTIVISGSTHIEGEFTINGVACDRVLTPEV